MQAFDRSIAVYEKAVHLYPAPSTLHLDYARVLYGLHHLSKADMLLKTYRLVDSGNVEADIMTAYIYLWNGQYEMAAKKANLLLHQYPENPEAKDILRRISNFSAPYYKTGIEFLSDDQPLKGTVFYAEGGVYKSWLFAPTAQVAFYQYNGGDNPFHSSWIQLSNAVQYKMVNSLKIKAGVFKQNSNESAFTGSIALSRKIANNFLLQASFERRPYQYTISSLNNEVMENVSAITLDYDRKDQWMGKAGYESLKYKDNNKITNAYLWIMGTVFSGHGFTISAGYAFQYADALQNNFVNKVPIHELVNSQTFENLAGVYSPYFTPENQKVHSALAKANVNLTKKLQFSSRMSVGVIASSDNPYMWLDEPAGDYVVFKGYMPVNFMPLTWASELRLVASDKFSLAATYTYDKLLYYRNHRGGIELKYHFLK
jgi:hypothetical protein